MSDGVTEVASWPAGPATGLDYDAALRRVMGLADFERSSHSPGHAVFHLERMSLLMERLGSPERDVPAVHIAGTKGKGSTAAMVTSALAAEGYKAGLYTSPHLHSVVERIRVGLDPVRHREFSTLVEQTWPAVEWTSQRGGYGDVTTFEMLTAMAFLHFKQVGADFQVIEVGLGGRLDATNVVTPEVSVITAISLDHVATLGNTLKQIAREKAGIIKHGVPVVVAPQPPEALGVIRGVAARNESRIVEVGKDVSWRKRDAAIGGQSIDVVGLRARYEARLPLLGDHQLENAATAVAALESLADRGFPVSSRGILEGLRHVKWPGRLQVLSRDGDRVVVDGAHNPDSMRRLMQAVRQYFDARRAILIFGATAGHSAREMLAETTGLAPAVIAVRSRHPRSSPAGLIARSAREAGLAVDSESTDVGQATRRALEIAREGDLVLATGSLSVVAEVIEEIEGIAPELYPDIKMPSDSPLAT